MFSYPSYIFIVFPCTSFLKISYCANVLSGACTHHGLLLSIHFHKAIANSASVILIGLILFFFYFCFLRSVVFAAGVLAAVTVFRNISRGEMLLPHAIRSRAREGETLRSWWAWHKERGKKRKKKKHLHSWKSWEERVLRQNAGRWRWNPLRDSKSESERSVDLQRTIVCNSFIQVYSV